MHKNSIFYKVSNEPNLAINEDIIIAIRNFSKKYAGQNTYSVKDVNIDVKKGQFHAFVGSNGAGKTTTIKAIIGATKIFEGDIFINRVSNYSSKALSQIAYIPEIALFPNNMTLEQFLKWNGRMIGLKNKELITKIDEIIKYLKLEKFRKKRPSNFSSGEQKKTLLAQALLKNAEVFVMDEPAANLDPQTRYELFQLMKKLQGLGKAIFISSHVLNEVGEYADSVTIIENGEIKISGFISEFSGVTKHKYILLPFNEKLFLNFLIKSKTIYEKKGDNFSINFNSEDDLIIFLGKAAKDKVFFKSINKSELGLKEIYSENVLKDNEKMH